MNKAALFLGSLLRNHSLQGSLIFAVSGAAFAIGNLLIAGRLETADYGRFALFFAILVVSSGIAPLGIDQLLLRREIPLDRRILRQILLHAVPIALGTAVVAGWMYRLPSIETAILAAATIIAGFQRCFGSALRRHGRRIAATAADTATDWVLLTTGTLALVAAVTNGREAILTVGFGVLLTAIVSGTIARRLEIGKSYRNIDIHWNELLPLLGIAAAGLVLVQAERLFIPLLLSLEDLAIFGVLTSVAIAPFRVLSAGILTSLTQQMRAANGPAQRRALLKREVRIFIVLTAGATFAVCLLAPLVANLLTGGRYLLSIPLVLAGSINGIGKVIQSVPRAIAVGIGSPADLHRVNASIWLCVAGTLLGAIVGSPWGLTATILGAALGNLICTLPAVAVAYHVVCRPAAAPH